MPSRRAPREESPRLVVALTGASGMPYAVRFLETLHAAGRSAEIVVTPTGARCLSEECGLAPRDLAGPKDLLHDPRDLGAEIASGAHPTLGMVVIPATMGTCGRIAAGIGEDLVVRAAEVTLKEKRPLVLVLRETPLTAIALENLLTLARAGAVILPASPGFYHAPKKIEDLLDFVVERALAHVGIRPGRVRYTPRSNR